MKENDLLKVSLAQGKAGTANGPEVAESDALKLAEMALPRRSKLAGANGARRQTGPGKISAAIAASRRCWASPDRFKRCARKNAAA